MLPETALNGAAESKFAILSAADSGVGEHDMARPAAVDPIDDAGEGLDLRQLGRSALWTILAVLAMVGTILAARSELGARRINEALNGGISPDLLAWSAHTAPLAGTTAQFEAETRRLGRAIQNLAADRDRLLADRDRIFARLAALERSIDVTGSVPTTPRQGTGADVVAASSPGQVVASVTLIPPKVDDVAPPPLGLTAAASRQAVASPSTEDAALAAAGSIVTRTQFGIDLGPAAGLDTLRAHWTSLKAQHGALLDGLRPLVAGRETGPQNRRELRLVVGPLLNAAAAARLCAALAATERSCQPAPYEGQQFAEQ
jgi:hypothetical protein